MLLPYDAPHDDALPTFITLEVTSLKKGIWKYPKHSIFLRQGSSSKPVQKIELKNSNKVIVEDIEKNARNNIELTLNGVFDFMNQHNRDLNPTYKVFKDQFVVCWAGIKKVVKGKVLYSRVDIELINEQIRLFYSALDEVEIEYNTQSFIITEYLQLGIDKDHSYYPLEKTIINFKDNGVHNIASELLFVPPKYDNIVLQHIYNSNNTILSKLQKDLPLNKGDKADLKQLPTTYMICYLNGFKDAKNKLESAKPYLKEMMDKSFYISLKETLRVLRKIKYNQ